MTFTMIWVIVGMAVVTYIPRMLPLVFMNAQTIPVWLQAILRNVPYAALGALIFPGVLTVHDNPAFGIIGALVAITVAFLGANLIIVVLSSIVALSILSLFI
ncbi:AzlD domain-containing protein [Halalkalibacter urbisdiaboli]|uniref:AzlD domain-containing protein n=1 Tax=Halalkalibacter urbisdiaboli TaxID=1960589 RepID=UPI000B45088A|nr:AzlD domain-containing protein [Halalkalibacter urbisdiaboli]